MKRVYVESPFAAPDAEGLERNRQYLLACMRDSVMRGEAPMASHLLFTQFLDDDVPGERALGLAAGFTWGECAAQTVVYNDLGTSSGMALGIERATAEGRPVEWRRLPGFKLEEFPDGGFCTFACVDGEVRRYAMPVKKP